MGTAPYRYLSKRTVDAHGRNYVTYSETDTPGYWPGGHRTVCQQEIQIEIAVAEEDVNLSGCVLTTTTTTTSTT